MKMRYIVTLKESQIYCRLLMIIDACTKAYVDNYISATKRILDESLVRIKFKLIPGSSVSKTSLSNEHQFDHNFFIQGV